MLKSEITLDVESNERAVVLFHYGVMVNDTDRAVKAKT